MDLKSGAFPPCDHHARAGQVGAHEWPLSAGLAGAMWAGKRGSIMSLDVGSPVPNDVLSVEGGIWLPRMSQQRRLVVRLREADPRNPRVHSLDDAVRVQLD